LTFTRKEFKLSFLSPYYHCASEPDPWEVKTLKTDNEDWEATEETFHTANSWTPQISQEELAVLHEVHNQNFVTYLQEQVVKIVDFLEVDIERNVQNSNPRT
jgi:hypothetical protein